jgi:preprotein translocase subunit SecD
MPSRLRAWLLAVIVLVVAALFDAYVHPLLSAAQPRPAVKGGVRVVLRGRPVAEHEFVFGRVTAADEEAEMAFLGKVAAVLQHRAGLESPAVDVVGRRGLTIRAEVRGESEANQQAQELMAALSKEMGSAYGPVRHVATRVLRLQSALLDPVVRNLERRAKGLGVSGAVVQAKPPDKVVVELPAITNPDRVIRLLCARGILEFRHIPKKYKVETLPTSEGEGTVFLDSADREVPPRRVLAESPIIVRGDQLKPNSVYVYYNPGSKMPVVAFSFYSQGTDVFWKFTRTHKGQYLAIVLDRKVISVPIVREAIRDGRGIIAGLRSIEQAGELSTLLNAGALPVPLEVVSREAV